MSSSPITSNLPAPGRFWTFNREERNAVAVLVGLLTVPGNLAAFAEMLEWEPADLDDAEVSVEWTYLRDLWHVHSQAGDVNALRAAILDSLLPSNAAELRNCSIADFNAHFRSGRPSATRIESPSNWSLERFDRTISDNGEFLRTCKFKWAFNIKPDLVVQTPSGHVLCVEAKQESAEGSYPSSGKEKAIYDSRGARRVKQTELQQYLIRDLLGFTAHFAYLATRQITNAAGRCITWAELLARLDRAGSPRFIQDWCAMHIARPHTLGRLQQATAPTECQSTGTPWRLFP